MISMRPTRLSQLAAVSAGQTAPKDNEFSDEGTPFVRAGSLDDLLSGKHESELELVSNDTAKLRKLRLYPKGTILFAKSGMSATKDRVYALQHPAHIVSHLAALVPNDDTHGEYLRLALKRYPPSALIKDPAYPSIGLGDIQNYEIPVPERYRDQIRIAQLLGKVEGLIAQRQQHLQHLDALLKSVFLEMFGNPVRNEKGWDKMPLEKLGSVNRGVSKHRPRNDPLLLGGRHPLIQTGEVSNADIYVTTYKQTYSDIGFAQSKMWPAGTLCITIAANIAQTGILTFDACFPDSVVGFVPYTSESNVLYVSGLFWFFQAILEKNAPAAAQRNINLEILRGLEVPKPPIDLQNQFATVVNRIVALKSRYRQSLTDLEALYAALSQHAFKGDLDLSRIPLPAVVITPSPAGAQASAPDLNVVIGDSLAQYLPGFDYTAERLASASGLHALLDQWLPIWCNKLGSVEFSAQRFIEAAQYRLEDLHPEAEFKFASAAQEHVKAWVFQALADGRLSQTYDEASKRIQLKAAQA